MWGTILEKAWAKVKGSYSGSEGGWGSSGVRALIGAPVFDYSDLGYSDVDWMYDYLVSADNAGYVMGAYTASYGSDTSTNACGIALGHAYSLVTAFSMWDAWDTQHDMLMIRNPWGIAYYNGQWSSSDYRWT